MVSKGKEEKTIKDLPRTAKVFEQGIEKDWPRKTPSMERNWDCWISLVQMLAITKFF